MLCLVVENDREGNQLWLLIFALIISVPQRVVLLLGLLSFKQVEKEDEEKIGMGYYVVQC